MGWSQKWGWDPGMTRDDYVMGENYDRTWDTAGIDGFWSFGVFFFRCFQTSPACQKAWRAPQFLHWGLGVCWPPQIAALLQVLCLRLYGSQGVGKENGRSLWDLVHVKLEITFLDLVCTQWWAEELEPSELALRWPRLPFHQSSCPHSQKLSFLDGKSTIAAGTCQLDILDPAGTIFWSAQVSLRLRHASRQEYHWNVRQTQARGLRSLLSLSRWVTVRSKHCVMY